MLRVPVRGGGITYIRHILPALVQHNPKHEYHILLSPRYQEALIAGLPDGVHSITPDLPAAPPFRRLWYLQTMVPQLLRNNNFDLLFATSEAGTGNAPCPIVVLVRNANFYASSKLSSSLRYRLFLFCYRMFWGPFVYRTLHRAKHLIFVSEAFRNEISKLLHLDSARSHVIHHGLSPAFNNHRSSETAHSFTLGEQPYLLAVSTLAPHKNYAVLLQGFARIVAQPGASDLHLAIAGSCPFPAFAQALLSSAQALGIGDRVHFLGHVPYDQLPALYSRAYAFVFPSRLETFGHPLVEAMACGVPVIASNIATCREICQDAASYFPPDDPDMLVNHILTVIHNADVRQLLVQKGLQRAKHFSWDRTGRQLGQVFEEAVQVERRRSHQLG